MTGRAGAHGWAALGRRSRSGLRAGSNRVRFSLLLALQTGLAAGLAWFIAHDVIGHPAPFFAPIAAVITLAVSIGHRLRRAAELVIGVAVGIGIGDALIMWIGTGPVQIAVVVGLAILVAIFLGSGSALVTQAAVSAVLVATLTPGPGLSFPRFVDALVGGVIGLVVMAVLLPANPLTVVSRATRPVLVMLADGLAAVADALRDRDVERADETLQRLRAGEEDLTRFHEALEAARETATLAPVRWRSRGALAGYVDSADQIGYALRNSRVLVRRSIRVIVEREPVPPSLPEAVARLGAAVRCLDRELARAATPAACREQTLAAVRHAAEAYAEGVGFSGSVVVAQIRSASIDLLRACGVTGDALEDLIRDAWRRPDPDDREG